MTRLTRMNGSSTPPSIFVPNSGPIQFLLNRFLARFADTAAPFDLVLPDNSVMHVGHGAATFRVHAKTSRGLRALASLDSGNVGGAYVTGDLDIDGEMLRPFELRSSMGDRHFLTLLWRFVQPMFFGQVYTNRQAITAHYDIDPQFFVNFLDPKIPCYTQGIYLSDKEFSGNCYFA